MPEVPNATEAEANGIALGEFNKILLKKIEELTLHAIETKKHIQQQDKEIQTLKELINNNLPRKPINSSISMQ